MPWLAVIAAMRDEPRSGQITPEPVRRKCGATSRRSTCSSVSLVSAKTIQSGAGAGFARLDGDAADDAVAAGRGGDADFVAVGAIALDRRGEVDRLGPGVDPDRLTARRSAAGEPRERRQEKGYGERDDPQRFGLSSGTHTIRSGIGTGREA